MIHDVVSGKQVRF